jgi:hypothetical protein
MKAKRILLIGFFLCFLPNLGLADCTDLTRMTSRVIQDEETILFYSGNTLLATVVLDDCPLDSSVNIRLLKNYVCDGDEILINGQLCTIMTVDLASTGSE